MTAPATTVSVSGSPSCRLSPPFTAEPCTPPPSPPAASTSPFAYRAAVARNETSGHALRTHTCPRTQHVTLTSRQQRRKAGAVAGDHRPSSHIRCPYSFRRSGGCPNILRAQGGVRLAPGRSRHHPLHDRVVSATSTPSSSASGGTPRDARLLRRAWRAQSPARHAVAIQCHDGSTAPRCDDLRTITGTTTRSWDLTPRMSGYRQLARAR
jgi:hypothetical protein